MPLIFKILIAKIGYILLRPYIKKLIDDPKSKVDDKVMDALDLAIDGRVNVKTDVQKPDK